MKFGKKLEKFLTIEVSMRKLHFNTTEEFESLFKKEDKAVTDSIVRAIEMAIVEKKRTAKIFEITFLSYEEYYEISLPKSQWAHALQSCLDFYHKHESVDEAIDTWKLLELVKVS